MIESVELNDNRKVGTITLFCREKTRADKGL